MDTNNPDTVVVDLRDPSRPDREVVEAEHLGGDTFRLTGVPLYAYGLHRFDVVRAVHSPGNRAAVVSEVIERSGHRTLRIDFGALPGRPIREREEILGFVRERPGVTVYPSGAEASRYAVDVGPDGDHRRLYDMLWRMQHSGLLRFDTGEATGDAAVNAGLVDPELKSRILSNNFVYEARYRRIDRPSYEALCTDLASLAQQWRDVPLVDKELAGHLIVVLQQARNLVDHKQGTDQDIEAQDIHLELDRLINEVVLVLP